MSSARAIQAAAGARPVRLKMKDLERATGVGREAIRFYIREGLLPQPTRPARNVAYYEPACIDRIRFIKELQHKRYLPLHVIKAIVGAEAAPSRVEVEALLTLNGKLFPPVAGALAPPRERVNDIARRVGLAAREIRDLADAGVVEIVTRDGEPWVEDSAVRIIEMWARLRAEGYTDELGFTPATARMYLDMVRWLAREEVRIFSRAVGGRVPTEKAARMAELGIDFGNQLIALLRKDTILRLVATGNVPESQPRKRRS